MNLGKTGRDKITGFEGVIVGYCTYLFGCNTYGLAPSALNKDGKRPDTEWFDEGRIEITDAPIIEPSTVQAKKPGADYNHDTPR